MTKRIFSFNQIVEDILREKNIDSLLEKTVEKITEILHAKRATFFFFNKETQELWSYVATDLEISEIRVPLGKGIVGKAALDKKLLNIKDAYKCKFFDRRVDKQTRFHTKTVMCIPLLDKNGKLLGAIEVLNKKRGYFTKYDEDIFRRFSFYITIALENIRLVQEKEALFRSTLYALAGAIDAKDPVTAGHSHRVAYLAVRIAQELGYSDEEVKIVEYAAYLHDVGKIGISDHVLQKKRRLTAEEYDLIKKHPLYTLQILKNILFSKETQRIPYIASYHHEFLNGSGYPFGLKDTQIDIFSRIITVADMYDALVSFDRPYKKPLSVEEALNILKEEVKRKHLDRKIVATFLKKKLYKHERRRYKRIDLNTSISYQIISQRKVFKKHIKDKEKVASCDLDILRYEREKSSNISEGGLLFLTRQYIPVGTYLDLEIDFSIKQFKCIGKVVWVEKMVGTPNYKVGVGFINLSSRTKKRLSKELYKLSLRKQV